MDIKLLWWWLNELGLILEIYDGRLDSFLGKLLW